MSQGMPALPKTASARLRETIRILQNIYANGKDKMHRGCCSLSARLQLRVETRLQPSPLSRIDFACHIVASRVRRAENGGDALT
jgi:hypothetical protein